MGKPRIMMEVDVLITDNVGSKVYEITKGGEYLPLLKLIAEQLIEKISEEDLCNFLMNYEKTQSVLNDKDICMKLAKDLSELDLKL